MQNGENETVDMAAEPKAYMDSHFENAQDLRKGLQALETLFDKTTAAQLKTQTQAQTIEQMEYRYAELHEKFMKQGERVNSLKAKQAVQADEINCRRIWSTLARELLDDMTPLPAKEGHPKPTKRLRQIAALHALRRADQRVIPPSITNPLGIEYAYTLYKEGGEKPEGVKCWDDPVVKEAS